MKTDSLEELGKAYARRERRLALCQPSNFRSAMLQVKQVSVEQMDQLVYSTPAPCKRSGNLRGEERVEFESASAAFLVNAATSEFRGMRRNYARLVHNGHKAADKGSRYYAWMKDPRSPRPTTWEEWLAARNAGLAVLTHRIRATSPRPWRNSAVREARARGLIVRKLQAATAEAMRE